MGRSSSSSGFYLYLRAPRICCNRPGHPHNPLPVHPKIQRRALASGRIPEEDKRVDAPASSTLCSSLTRTPGPFRQSSSSFCSHLSLCPKEPSDLGLTSHWMPDLPQVKPVSYFTGATGSSDRWHCFFTGVENIVEASPLSFSKKKHSAPFTDE